MHSETDNFTAILQLYSPDVGSIKTHNNTFVALETASAELRQKNSITEEIHCHPLAILPKGVLTDFKSRSISILAITDQRQQ